MDGEACTYTGTTSVPALLPVLDTVKVAVTCGDGRAAGVGGRTGQEIRQETAGWRNTFEELNC